MKTKCTRYVVRGSVRGTISTNHRTLSAAVRSMLRDCRQCSSLGGGSYSDARIERSDGEPLTDDELDAISDLTESTR